MEILAWAMLVLMAIGQLASVYLIGKPRPPRTANDVVMGMVLTAPTVALCGRVLGWW
jgi:hypothetical protein